MGRLSCRSTWRMDRERGVGDDALPEAGRGRSNRDGAGADRCPTRRPHAVRGYIGGAGPGGLSRAGCLPAYSCGRDALAQWRLTTNLVLGSLGMEPLLARPQGVCEGVVPGGRSYTVERFYGGPQLSAGGEFWTVHGMAHRWSGGSTAPEAASLVDGAGPDAATAAWEFLSPVRREPRSCAGRRA